MANIYTVTVEELTAHNVYTSGDRTVNQVYDYRQHNEPEEFADKEAALRYARTCSQDGSYVEVREFAPGQRMGTLIARLGR